MTKYLAPGDYYNGFYFPAAGAWMCQDIWVFI
jgi:alpha-L-fucosidase 2